MIVHRGNLLKLLQSRASANRPHVRSVTTSSKSRDDLLRGVSTDNRDDVARVLELAERARDSWQIASSVFLTPPIVADSMLVLQRLADITAMPWGGYSQAERCRIAVGREEEMAGALSDPGSVLASVAAVKVEGNFLFDPATHPDFLGSILGTGIERQVVGDILVQGDRGAQILVSSSMVEHVESALTQVRSVPVKTRAIPLSELRVPVAKVVEIQSTEASLRLDAIASAGFRMSRSKMSDLIKKGDVRVNWRGGAKTSVDISQGDVISVNSKGRVEVKNITQTKKGKFSVEMVRYV